MGLLKEILKPVINNVKGAVGEKQVDKKLNPWFFGRVEHKQINNLILYDDNGKTHQIDHVEIRRNGIFVIETKNYGGSIYGSENQEKWTQCMGGQKNQFLNPLKQNKSHIYYINQVLDKKYKINSVVVFVQNNTNKLKINNVVNLDDLKTYLANFNDGTNYTDEEMEDIYNTLLNANNKISNREHVKNIHDTQNDIKNGICPRCHGKLVERQGKYGKFIACSNYPKCTFVLKDKNIK